MIENADAAEMRHGDGHDNGVIFFSSNLSEEMIQVIQRQIEKLTENAKSAAK